MLKRTADGFSITCLPDLMVRQAPVTRPKYLGKAEPLNLDIQTPPLQDLTFHCYFINDYLNPHASC